MAFNVRQIFAALNDGRVASIPRPSGMKQRSGRPRDLEDVDRLRQIQAAGNEGAS